MLRSIDKQSGESVESVLLPATLLIIFINRTKRERPGRLLGCVCLFVCMSVGQSVCVCVCVSVCPRSSPALHVSSLYAA